MSAAAVAAVIGALADEPWMPRVSHWEIATTDEVWGAHAELDCETSGPAFRELHALADRVGSEVSVVSDNLTAIDFVYDEVPVRVWWLRPALRWVVPESCATCPTKLSGEPGARFVRLGEGDREAPVICVPCRDRMQAEFVAAGHPAVVGALLTGEQLAEYRSADIGDWCQGPWTQDSVEGPTGEAGHFLVKDRDGQTVAMVPHWAGSIALFIAVARDAVPALLAELDEMRTVLAQSEQELTGARLALWEEEQDTRRLRLALKSARRGRAAARERVAALEAEREFAAEAGHATAPTPVLSGAERAYLHAALSLLTDSINDGVTDEPDGFTSAELAPALASLRKLAGGGSR